MRRSWIVGLTMALTLVALSATVFAQVESDTPSGSEAVAVKGKKWRQRKEQARALFLKRLGEELALDESTVEKLVHSFDRHKEQFRALHQERKVLKTKLPEAVDSGAPDTEIETILAEVQAFRDRLRQIRTDHQTEMHQILGTRGYAKYLIFKQKFRREMHGRMHKRRGSHRGSQYQTPRAFQPLWG